MPEVAEFSDPAKPVVAPHEVAIDGPVVSYAYGRPDQPNTDKLLVFAAEERTIFGQDQRIIESQPGGPVPLEGDAELHMAFDKVALAYRRALRENGF